MRENTIQAATTVAILRHHRGWKASRVAAKLGVSSSRVTELIGYAREQDLMPEDFDPIAMGVFIFAGGFTLGVRQHFHVLHHLENGMYGVDTAKRNLPGLSVAIDQEQWPLDFMRRMPIDFIYSNPPCAPWSAAGSRVGSTKRDFTNGFDLRDERVVCVEQSFGVLEAVRPRVWLWESVTRAFTAGRPLVNSLARRAMKMGYSVTIVLHNGLDCGAPQNRKRMFLLAHDAELDIQAPAVVGPKTVGEALASMSKNAPTITHKTDYMELLKATSEGGKLRKTYDELHGDTRITERGTRLGRPSFLYQRLTMDKPAPVITGTPAFYHPTEDRKFTIAEQAVLCGYPEDYDFIGPIGKRYQQIAQAVMPPVGAWIAGEVWRALDDPRDVRRPTFRCIDFIDGKRTGDLDASS